MKAIIRQAIIGAALLFVSGMLAVTGFDTASHMFFLWFAWTVIGPVFRHLAGMNQEIDHSGEVPKHTHKGV